MKVKLNANWTDQQTDRIADVLRVAFKPVAKDVSKDYGGMISPFLIPLPPLSAKLTRTSAYFSKTVLLGVYGIKARTYDL